MITKNRLSHEKETSVENVYGGFPNSQPKYVCRIYWNG